MTLLPTQTDSPEDRNAVAKVWMQRGIALLSADDPNALPEALRCFNEALSIRRELPFEESSWFRWLLTACWMNRGDVQTRLGDTQNLTEAVQSFDEAIFHLVRLPLDEDPQYRGRLVLAWMNRSLALRALTKPDEALSSLEKAQQALEEGVTHDRPANLTLLATLMTNRAALLLEISSPALLEAMRTAEAVLELSRSSEKAELLAAEIGLKARHAFCHAVAMLLETPPVDTTRADDWIMQATDKVEEAMHLTTHWESKRMPRHFLGLRHELFQYGCRMYLAYQPHFMAEFLLDVLDPERGSPLLARTTDLCQAGLDALNLAAAELRRRGPLDLGLQGVDRIVGLLEALNTAAERIRTLCSQ
jgi:tetratricopeptide (TPR) repeat protein